MGQTFNEWRRALPEPAMRMIARRELKWWLAAKLMGWAFDLTQDEMSPDAMRAFADALSRFKNDPKFNTVKMQPPR